MIGSVVDKADEVGVGRSIGYWYAGDEAIYL
jgi:hypothetical protein